MMKASCPPPCQLPCTLARHSSGIETITQSRSEGVACFLEAKVHLLLAMMAVCVLCPMIATAWHSPGPLTPWLMPLISIMLNLFDCKRSKGQRLLPLHRQEILPSAPLSQVVMPWCVLCRLEQLAVCCASRTHESLGRERLNSPPRLIVGDPQFESSLLPTA